MVKKDVAYTDSGVLLSHKNEILSFETTWVGLEGIMLSEISQRDKYPDFTYIENLYNK